jgi:hypothetical protein
MRNLVEYPITHEEIMECLARLSEVLSYDKTGLVGDMRPLLLDRATEIVRKDWMDSFPK